MPLRVRSLVGMIPLFAVEVLEGDVISKMPGFQKRMDWFLKNRPDLARHITYMKPAHATVFLNGVLLHNHKELMGPTVHRELAKYVAQPAAMTTAAFIPFLLATSTAPARPRRP